MSDIKHTPGPWKVAPSKAGFWASVCADHGPDDPAICEIPHYAASRTWRADASLIASAPELLYALRDLVEDLEVRSTNGVVNCSHGVYCDARQAIAKAEGRS